MIFELSEYQDDYAEEKELGSFVLEATNELIQRVDEMRRNAGNTDLVSSAEENDVYYNFYAIIDYTSKTVRVESYVNHSEKDDWACYNVKLRPEERQDLLFSIASRLRDEIFKD